jgi:hypothetical protein
MTKALISYKEPMINPTTTHTSWHYNPVDRAEYIKFFTFIKLILMVYCIDHMLYCEWAHMILQVTLQQVGPRKSRVYKGDS